MRIGMNTKLILHFYLVRETNYVFEIKITKNIYARFEAKNIFNENATDYFLIVKSLLY